MAFNTYNGVIRKIEDAIDGFSMLSKGDRVLVGFSGGKDSTVLLHALSSLAGEYGIEVVAVHVNHGIRGSEAERDEKFCRDFCGKNGIEFVCERVDAPGFSKENGVGLEEGARILRYGVFEKIAKAKGANKTATAHTASDNMETVLFNLIRGSSTDGMKGIPPVRENIIRPLIYCSSDEILEYASENSLPYVTDSTNADTEYARNHIRHNIIPLIKQINPSAETAFLNMCDGVRRDVNFISSCADAVTSEKTAELAALPDAVLTRVLVSRYKEKENGKQLSHTHVLDMVGLIRRYAGKGDGGEKRMSLPGKTDLVVTVDRVSFENPVPSYSFESMTLHTGVNELGDSGDIVVVCDENFDINDVLSKNVYKKSIHTIVKKSVFADTITVRRRFPGDVFCFSNMTKRVKKMMNEAKIPLGIRDRLPVFCDGKGIFWIAGFPLRDDVLPTTDDESVGIYYLTQETENER